MPSPKRLGNNLLVEPPDLQQETIQAIYDVFREGGRWPTVDAIDRLVDEQWEADAYPLLKGLPPSLALLDRLHLRADQTVKLRVAAIAGCRNAEADLDLFVTAVRWLVLCERSRRPTDPHIAETLQVTSEEFAAARLATEGTQVNRVDSAKVYELVAVENLNWGGTAHIEGDPGRWQLNLTRTIRPYRRVEALADYLEIRRRTEEEAEKEAAAAGIPLTLNEVAGEAVAHPVTDTEPYIFIAMPFEEPWSEDLYETIGTACESLGREGIVFRRERADEISRPGRVTEQIIDAIERADVVIADIGGLNANVVYELGYAHAGKATLILLSQNPEGSPFDLRDLRQIRYSTAEPAECLEELTRQLAAALGVTLQTPTDATRSQNRPEPFPSD